MTGFFTIKKDPSRGLGFFLGAEFVLRPDIFTVRKDLLTINEMCGIMNRHATDLAVRFFANKENFHAHIADENFIIRTNSAANFNRKLQAAFLKISGAGPFIQAATLLCHPFLLF